MRSRLHLFEFHDQPWFPRTLRDAATAYLALAYRQLPLPRVWAQKLSTLFTRGVTGEILDLGSGSGGPIPLVLQELETLGFTARARLTDLYPNLHEAAQPGVSWIAESVDATAVPPDLPGVRTMFSVFHHFRPDGAKAVLQNAFDAGRSICIFEALSGTALGLATMVLVPLNVLALMPLVRPFRWSYLVFTYLVPVIPLFILWDGVVSMLRIYSPEEMLAMTESLQRTDYAWEAGLIPMRGVPGGLPYLIGRGIPLP